MARNSTYRGLCLFTFKNLTLDDFRFENLTEGFVLSSYFWSQSSQFAPHTIKDGLRQKQRPKIKTIEHLFLGLDLGWQLFGPTVLAEGIKTAKRVILLWIEL